MAGRTIRLTDSEFDRIIRESVSGVLDDGPDPSDVVDINAIPVEVLRKAYIDYRLIPNSVMYGDRLHEPNTIKEAVGDIALPDQVVHDITAKYMLPPMFVRKVEHYHKIYIYVVTALIGKNAEMIEDDMGKLGYFLSRKGEIVNVDGMQYQVLQFEPSSQLQEDITDLVKSRYDVLFHWTPAYCVEGIMARGLVPSRSNELFKYPPRTYLMTGDANMHDLTYLGIQLCAANTDERNDGMYALILVTGVRNLDDSIRFFWDPNSNIGIYTEQPIPSGHTRLLNIVRLAPDMR